MIYQTKNLNLAATLTVIGYEVSVMEIDKDNKSVVFSFSDGEELQHMIDQYWRKEVKIEPQAYNQAYRELKTRASEYVKNNS